MESSGRENIAAYGTERDSLREEILLNMEENVTEHEVVTETVFSGDTVKTVRVTERVKGRNQISTQETKLDVVRIVRDTVVVERRDSVLVQDSRFLVHGDQSERTALHTTLKWIFWILICVIVLVIVFKVTRFINLK